MIDYLNTTTHNIGWFHQIHLGGGLDMKPPFQRKPVWVTRQKSFLIDTILRGYPIPEIYMQENVDEDGNSKHIVVDGQQRIRAFLEFIEGNFVMDAKDSPDFAEMSFDDLSPQQKKSIFQYRFVVRTLPELSEVELRDIFKRINTNVLSLNAQELRQAAYWGPFISTMNDLSNLSAWASIGLFTANDIRRMLDVEFVSELAVAHLHGYQNKKVSLDKYYQLYEEEFDCEQQLRETFDVVLREILHVLPDVRRTRWSKKSDFYTLFHYFASYVDKLPLSSEKRSRAAKELIDFASQVNDFGKATNEKERAAFPANVRDYSRGVIKAASDLGSRKARGEALAKELDPIFWNKIIVRRHCRQRGQMCNSQRG